MTPEEAIETLKNTAWLGTDNGIKVYPAIRVAVDALEKQERYMWHDLRKNPNDLPKDNERDLLVFTNGAFVVWTGKLLNICKAGVDRWKRIETFEEEE